MRFNKELDSIKTYEAGKPIEEVVRSIGLKEEEVIKLASNENPFGPSLRVIECIKNNAYKASLYPDDSMSELLERVARHYDVARTQCIIGAGSDQIIELSFHAKLQKGSKILIAGVTFAMYEIYAKHIGAHVIRTKSITHDAKELWELFIAHKPEIICLCVPNNPLGECMDAQCVYEFIARVHTESAGESLVLVDGAYQEFASFKDVNKHIVVRDVISRFDNVLYLGTFSKVYGLGGMRVGYGIAHTDIIKALYKLRAPFNVTTLSLAAACTALEDGDFVRQSLESNAREMQRYEAFAVAKHIDYIPSYTNFLTLLLTPSHDCTILCNSLLQRGIIIRSLASYHLNAIRITIGTNTQNTRVLAALDELL